MVRARRSRRGTRRRSSRSPSRPTASKLYFATLNNDGTDLYSVAPDGTDETQIAHLSDEIARDWKLSPDGAQLAYSVADSGSAPAMIAQTLDLATAAISDAIAPSSLQAGPPSTGIARGEFNPAWRGDGALTVAASNSMAAADAMSIDADGAIAAQVTHNSDGIDLPLGWSPDGDDARRRARRRQDAVRGRARATSSWCAAAPRERVSDSADVLIVGWLP